MNGLLMLSQFALIMIAGYGIARLATWLDDVHERRQQR